MNKSTHCCRADKKLEESDDPVEFKVVGNIQQVLGDIAHSQRQQVALLTQFLNGREGTQGAQPPA